MQSCREEARSKIRVVVRTPVGTNVPWPTTLARLEYERCDEEGQDRVTNTEQPSGDGPPDEEHFRPNGTIFILVLFVAALISSY
jgi:hypothetical protein